LIVWLLHAVPTARGLPVLEAWKSLCLDVQMASRISERIAGADIADHDEEAAYWLALAHAQRRGIRLSIAMEGNVPRISCWRNILTTSKTLTEAVSDMAKEAEGSVEHLGRSTGRKLDEARGATGQALHAAASSVRTTGRQGCEAIDTVATGAADRLDATACYVEDHDVRGMMKCFCRRHPMGAVVGAVAVGFLAGSALSRAMHSCCKGPAGA
jgi:ElaB/YqjD/DUF883 family membrane-anchored ribosome-binding protein